MYVGLCCNDVECRAYDTPSDLMRPFLGCDELASSKYSCVALCVFCVVVEEETANTNPT